MTLLPEKDLLAGTKEPETTTGEFRLAMGNLRQFICDLLGIDSEDKQATRDTLGVQEKYLAEAEGTADGLRATFATPILKPLHGMTVQVRSQSANTAAIPTFTADGTGTYPIVKGNNQPLMAGDIAGDGHWLDMKFDDTLKKWVLLNPAYGISVMPEIAPVLAEKADRRDLENYLQNTGGSMTGDLTMQAGQKINLQSNFAIGRAYLHKYDDTTWLVNTNSANETSAYISLADDGTIELHGNIKINMEQPGYVTSSYTNGTSWYRKWSDGWLEQGGQISNGNIDQTVTLLTPFASASYVILGDQTSYGSSSGAYFGAYIFQSRTTTSFYYLTETDEYHTFNWYACGQGA